MSREQTATVTIECGTDYLNDSNFHAEIQTEGSTAEQCIENAAIFWIDKNGGERGNAMLKDYGGKFYDLCERIIKNEFDATCMRRWEREQESARR